MLAVRETSASTRLPDSSRNWVSDKLVYTHGYGITMNPVEMAFLQKSCPFFTSAICRCRVQCRA